MSERFIKLIDSEETDFLLIHKPNAFRLLTIVAKRARRASGHPDGLKVGEALIGDWKNTGFTEQEYRTAKDVLVTRKHFNIVETCRTRKKSTTGTTTKGTKVKLISSCVYDINAETNNDCINDRATTEQRPSNDEQERIRTNQDRKIKGTIVRENEKEEKIVRPSFRSPPSFEEDLRTLNEFAIAMSLDIDSKDFSLWIKTFGKERIDLHLNSMLNQKRKVVKQAAWMQSALDRDYEGEKRNIATNFEFAKQLKEQKRWSSLRITKKYCCDEDTQKDYPFFLPPEQFKEALILGQKTKENIG